MRPILAALMFTPSAALAQASWPSAGNGAGNTRTSSVEHVLGPSNVAGLKPVWTLETTGDMPATPTVENGALYAVDNGGSVWRVDAATGKPAWHILLSAISGDPKSVARTSPAVGPSQIVIGNQASATLYALDKSSGAKLWATRLDRSRGAFITSSPVIVGSQVVVGVSSMQEELAATVKGFVPDFRGSVVALDLATGAVQWQFTTVPQGFTGGAVWGSNLAVDPSRHAVYAGTGDNYSVPAAVAQCQAQARNGQQLDRCLPATDHIDSILALDLGKGTPIWTRRLTDADTWTVSCIPSKKPPGTPCPQPTGRDYDFGSGPNLFQLPGTSHAVVGAGQKSGVYWVFDRDTGATVWGTQVNPGGTRGGVEWGSAVDATRVFVPASNSAYVWSGLVGSQKITNGGFWSALDAGTGQILWQTATTAKQPKPAKQTGRTINPPPGALARTEGAVSEANGVMYGADAAGNFVALNAATGALLWKYGTHAAAIDAPAIVDGRLYWGEGYVDIGNGRHELTAFGLK